MRAVNLLPNERTREATTRTSGGGALTTARVAVVGGSLAIIVSGLVGFTFVNARGDVADKRDALAAVEQQVEATRAEVAAQPRTQAQQALATALPADVKAQLDAFHMLESSRIQWDLLLGDVSRVLPKGSWLSSLTLEGAPPPSTAPADAAAPATPTTPTGFVASGFAFSHTTVARVMQQLARVPMLSDVTLQRSERTSVGNAKAFQFTLSANVRLDRAG